jgi:hypothetical protein
MCFGRRRGGPKRGSPVVSAGRQQFEGVADEADASVSRHLLAPGIMNHFSELGPQLTGSNTLDARSVEAISPRAEASAALYDQ